MSSLRAIAATEPLCLALRQWCEALETLRITAAEDQPTPGESALADRLADDADEVMGWLSEAAAGLEHSGDLVAAHRLVGRAIGRQGEALFGCVRQAHLEQLARGPDGRWRAWVSAVRSALAPLWVRSEEVVTLLASANPGPASGHGTVGPAPTFARPAQRGKFFQDKTILNPSN